MPTPDRVHWSRAAHDWIEWARRPGHDAFWFYRGGLATLLGPGRGATLDLGCGEGRVARLIRDLGYRVTAVGAVREMVTAAREADSVDAYAVPAAAALPFTDGSFDLVVAYNVLMDLDD
jgi:SAM-dependent methyltransferase